MRRTRIFHAAGPIDVIQDYRNWMKRETDRNAMSLNFSDEFVDFCRGSASEAYIVSSAGRKQVVQDAEFLLENRPKPKSRGGIWYHLAELRYGISLVRTALAFGAQVAVINSGSTHYFVMWLFRLGGMQVIPVMHNTLWPCGSSRRGIGRAFLKLLDCSFFRFAATSAIAVSRECVRQVHQLTHGKHCPMFEMKIQFHRRYFTTIPGPPPHNQRPFRIMFAGRINEFKGVFDLLHVAKSVQDRAPDSVTWEICGAGPDLDELRKQHCAMNLENIVTIRGWTSSAEMREVIARSHLAIVPTRSNFPEGFAMSAIEAILAGRPVITNHVVPALEVLKSACIEATTDDVDSYASAVLNVLRDRNLYNGLCNCCPLLAEQFYDRSLGFQAALWKAINLGQDIRRLSAQAE